MHTNDDDDIIWINDMVTFTFKVIIIIVDLMIFRSFFLFQKKNRYKIHQHHLLYILLVVKMTHSKSTQINLINAFRSIMNNDYAMPKIILQKKTKKTAIKLV